MCELVLKKEKEIREEAIMEGGGGSEVLQKQKEQLKTLTHCYGRVKPHSVKMILTKALVQ